ncbi:MAG: (d)CMP kinase [Desulfobacter postgatei]|jgi:cytidylate kinase|uniref:(d)CMP kinase n=1 Tax=Desulfobacter postgatei TaxID=2293 RepID=UPI0023F4F2B7|nr:(d)CMP kinase [Desulfobacter postgatei]MDD4272286.1 (d)CMP kinase [Desulfobacter postgatei]MDX9963158.1 (d)CMP kinase [Desulfobacter postgatei]
MGRRIVTIDGPAGAGKTTVSKALASELGWIYVDTGALYRAVAFEIKRRQINWEDSAQLERFLACLDLDFVMDGRDPVLTSSGRDISAYIRTNEISMLASATSAIPQVRRALLGIQKSIAAERDAVFEGRDMGTAVFPNASYKFFLTADVNVRARRRFEESNASGISFGKILEDMIKRDADDTQRAVSPLKQAPDALLIDATALNVSQVVEKMKSIIKKV